MTKLRIKNKRTGEIKEIEASEAQDFGLDPKIALERFKAQSELEKAAGGEDITLTEEEKKIQTKEAGAKEIIDQLFEIYYGKPGEKSLALTDPGKYRLPAQLKALGTKIQAGEANSIEERIYTYNRILESKRAKLAKAAGDAGNLAVQEQILAGRGLPGVDSTSGEAITLFNSAYDAFASGKKPERLTKITERVSKQFPQESIVSGQPPISQQPPQIPQQQLNPLEKLLMPIAQGPIGTGADLLASIFTPAYKKAIQKSARGEQVSLGEGVEAGGDILTTLIPALRLGKLGLAGKAALAGGTRGTTRDIPLEQRPLEAGKEAIIGGLLGNILRPGTIPKTLRNVGAEIARKKGITFSGKEIAKAGEEYVKRVPLAESISKKIIPSLKKENLTPQQLLGRLGEWWPLARTKGADPKSSAQGQFFNTLYLAARDQLAKKAPIASAGQTGLATLHKVGKGLGKIGGAAAFGGAATATGGLLYKLFPGLFQR